MSAPNEEITIKSYPKRKMTLDDYSNPTSFVGYDEQNLTENMAKMFESLIDHKTYYNATKSPNISELITTLGEKDYYAYKRNFILGADFIEVTLSF